MPGPADSARWLDTPLIRQAGRDMLSLALMDARNHTLQTFSLIEDALGRHPQAELADLHRRPLWLLGEVGWFQERWIGRNLQRHLGERCDASATRLPSIVPEADATWEARGADPGAGELPAADALRDFLLQTLESTLELLERAPETDEGLYFFRLALLHEDLQAELLMETAQSVGLPLAASRVAPAQALTRREPLWLPARRWCTGSGPQGFAFDNERPQLLLDVPEFEIDAQPVSWAQYVEFVDDGGYDQQALWLPEGWAWLQARQAVEGRRGPRYVEHIGVASGAVMQTHFGRATRMSALHNAMHLSWWEADAWCRWAGRRLPLEIEWEMAAEVAASRGFRWGDAWEWTASSLQPYPGFQPGPDAAYSQPWFGRARVLRGGSVWTRRRLKSPRFRRFAEPGRDELFCGFRSCAV